MKKILVISLAAFAITLLIGCTEGTTSEPAPLAAKSAPIEPPAREICPTPVSSLTQEMIDGLLFMREEEKVARDIYTVLGQKWNARIFTNIKTSEQQHMNTMLQMITQYGLIDPIQDDAVGVFTNPDLQALYAALVAQGSLTVRDAYTVGTIVEQKDIHDLVVQLGIVPAGSNLAKAYANLKLGSESHLASFQAALQRLP